VEAPHPNYIWQSDMTKVWAGPSVGWAYLVLVIDCCTREMVLPFGSRGTGLTLTTDNDPIHFGPVCRNAPAVGHHAPAHGLQPSRGQQHIERFHRSSKEEEVWLNE
jgi:hypothetical protein